MGEDSYLKTVKTHYLGDGSGLGKILYTLLETVDEENIVQCDDGSIGIKGRFGEEQSLVGRIVSGMRIERQSGIYLQLHELSGHEEEPVPDLLKVLADYTQEDPEE